MRMDLFVPVSFMKTAFLFRVFMSSSSLMVYGALVYFISQRLMVWSFLSIKRSICTPFSDESFGLYTQEWAVLMTAANPNAVFTQMGRYGSHVEQTYRNAFGLKKSKSIDWLKLNVSLAKRFFGKQGRWSIAIDPSYISKAGTKTPLICRFW